MSAPRKKYKMKAEMWLYPTETAAWHFIAVDKEVSREIKEKYGASRRGFGSVPVEVTIGGTTWQTSIFPDKKYGAYILPVKVHVRKKEGIFAGDIVALAITVR